MPIYTTNATRAQDGVEVLAAWNDTTAELALSSFVPTYIGLQFEIMDTSQFDALSRPIDPPLIYPSLDLTLNVSTVVWGAETQFPINVWGVQEAAPVPFSAAALPSNRLGALLVAGQIVNPATTVTITVPTTSMVPYWKQAAWNGVIALVLAGGAPVLSVLNFHSAESPTADVLPTIDAPLVPFFTGIDNHGVEMGRPVRDMKTGLPAHVPELIEDGYSPGMWTVPEQWDPADPRDDSPVEFPDNEGQWDDDVPAH